MGVTVTPLSNPLGTKLVKDLDSDATGENDVLAGACTVYIVDIDNTANAAVSYTKLYDAAAPTIGTTVPDIVLRVPSSKRRSFVIGAPADGQPFTNLSFATVTAGGTAGTTSPTSDVIVQIMAA